MDGIRCTVQGPGVLEAIRHAHSQGKQIYFAYDRNARGEILRLGYTLESPESGAGITWIDPGEYEVITAPCDEQFFDAGLNISFEHPKEHERHFLLDVPVGDNLKVVMRVLFRRRPSGDPDFVIQVELGKTGQRKGAVPVIRYDCAHGFLHCDRIAADGAKSKHPVSSLDGADAIAFILNEIQKNLPGWLSELGYARVDASPVAHSSLVRDLNAAGDLLVELLNDPDSAAATESALITYTDEIPGGVMPSLDGISPVSTKAELLAFLAQSPWATVMPEIVELIPDDALIQDVTLPRVAGQPITVTYSVPEDD